MYHFFHIIASKPIGSPGKGIPAWVDVLITDMMKTIPSIYRGVVRQAIQQALAERGFNLVVVISSLVLAWVSYALWKKIGAQAAWGAILGVTVLSLLSIWGLLVGLGILPEPFPF